MPTLISLVAASLAEVDAVLPGVLAWLEEPSRYATAFEGATSLIVELLLGRVSGPEANDDPRRRVLGWR